MNALNQTWDLLLAKAYNDGGGENSTRVDGKSGFDMQPQLYVEPRHTRARARARAGIKGKLTSYILAKDSTHIIESSRFGSQLPSPCTVC